MGIVEAYHYYVTERADPRTNDWFLVGSPLPVIIIICSYLYLILGCGKRYMQNRKPYSLKTFIRFYNIFQIVSNAFVVYGTLTSGYITGDLTFGCEPVDYSYEPLPYRMAKVSWCFYMLKLIDLLETVLFLLRKKNKQISVLHMYHHVSTFIICWVATKYLAGGMMTVIMLLNATVHVIMYTYYLCSSLDNSTLQNFSGLIKSHITKIQIMQLIILILHIQQGLWPSCPFPAQAALLIISALSGNIFLFLKFYRQCYMKNKKVK